MSLEMIADRGMDMEAQILEGSSATCFSSP